MNNDKENLLKIIDQITYLLELKGENVFKVSAFRKAYSILSGIQDDLSVMYESGAMAQLKGIGKGIMSVVADYYNMGYSSALRELEAEVPAGLIEINQIRGLGPKKAIQLYYENGITNLQLLEQSCLSGEVITIKGFTEASAAKLLENIRLYQRNQTQIRMNDATVIVSEIESILAECSEIEIFSVTGEYRRNMEVISTIEFVILTKNQQLVLDYLRERLKLPGLTYSEETGYAGKTKIMFHQEMHQHHFFDTLYLTTGSTEFVNKFAVNGDKFGDFNSEVDIFQSFDLPYIAPEMRESEFLPFIKDERFAISNLSQEDFKGCFHFHTNYSDGSNTLKEMVSAASQMGYEYFAVCDHSKASFQAHGLWEDRVFVQKEEILKVADELQLPIFHGIEADILRDGSLDYGDEFLHNFDFVVASIHSRFSQNKEDMTARILRAIENPHTDVLGHPSGRILLERPEYEADYDKIIDACLANNVAIEINASAYRLDLDWRRMFRARDKGCIFSINPDAHSTTQLQSVKYGIGVARKSGMKKEEVINCFSLDRFKTFIKRK